MLRQRFFSFRPNKWFLIVSFAVISILSMNVEVFGQKEQLLKQGGTYQASADTSDRAAERYRELIAQYPGSREAETAQFSLGSYYNRKFFILEQRDKVQDWDSFNKAEEALYKYVGMYPRGIYSADAYHTLAMISLRRGYTDNAIKLWNTMNEAAARDPKVYISRLTWSTNSEDLVKGYCDTGSLAEVSIGVAGKLKFYDAVNALTNWARANCASPQPSQSK
jgi:tetratricopeptide (TPR) repeat protein